MDSHSAARFLFTAVSLSALTVLAIARVDDQPEHKTKLAPAPVKAWGKLPDGRVAHLYTIRNAHEVRAEISDYGATITRLLTKDLTGKFGDIVLGFNTLEEYRTKSPYFGAIVGRYGNRIANGQFTLDGKTYGLAKNNTPGGLPCSLHGGNVGYDKRLWKLVGAPTGSSLTLELVDPAGTEGYPGTVTTRVKFELEPEDTLRISYRITTTAATPVNLTHHGYFNLNGEGNPSILDHRLQLNCSRYTPVTKGLIPTGELATVKGTPFDFKTSTEAIGARVNNLHPQLDYGGGYDHNFVGDKPTGKFGLLADVWAPSGRRMQVWSTEPGIQLYTGNFLDNTLIGKSGKPYLYRSAFCLETQHFPDSPNQPKFPTTIVRPGRPYLSVTEYRFSEFVPVGWKK